MNKAQAVARVASKSPALGESVFVAPNASVMGEVTLGRGSSVWYGAVVRGEWALLLLRTLPRAGKLALKHLYGSS